MPSRGITKILYTYMNLPIRVEMDKGKSQKRIHFSYDASGVKWGQKVTNNDGAPEDWLNIEHTYVDGFEFEGGNLVSANFGEGRINYTYDDNGTIEDSYISFYLQDHLGNNRIIFREDPQQIDQPLVIQENHYYPFGMSMGTELNRYTNQDPENRYKYNSKELTSDFDLNLHDYGARWYNASIGRWTSMDPLADSYASFSPYNYTLNNPIRFIDPDGRLVINGHTTARDESKVILDAAQKVFDSTSKKDKKAYRTARRNRNRASRVYSRNESKYNSAQEKIDGVKSRAPDLFEAANTLTDEFGSRVDVYVYDVDDKILQGLDESGNVLFGDTEATPVRTFNFQTKKNGHRVTSKLHEGNVTIRLNSKWANGSTLAHEFGHAIHNTRHASEYLKWLRSHPQERYKGGHGQGDPSGKAADKAESEY